MNEVTNIQQVVQQISSAERVQQIVQQQGDSQQKAFAQALTKEADQRQHEVNGSPEEGRVANEGKAGQQRKRKKRGPPQAPEQSENSPVEEPPVEEEEKGHKIDIRV